MRSSNRLKKKIIGQKLIDGRLYQCYKIEDNMKIPITVSWDSSPIDLLSRRHASIDKVAVDYCKRKFDSVPASIIFAQWFSTIDWNIWDW